MTGKELIALRKCLGYNLRDFGKKVGIPFQRLSEYEKGRKNLSLMTESQIKTAVGYVEDWKPDYGLHIHLDYLRLTFFGTTYQKVMTQIVGIREDLFFYEATKRHNYDGIYSCGMIQIYVSINFNLFKEKKSVVYFDTPKTEKSKGRVYLPSVVVRDMKSWQSHQADKLKKFVLDFNDAQVLQESAEYLTDFNR